MKFNESLTPPLLIILGIKFCVKTLNIGSLHSENRGRIRIE